MSERAQCIEAFQFYVDYIPDWFMDKVSANKVILRKCDHKKYRIDEAYCEIKTKKGVVIASGGDYIVKKEDGELQPYNPRGFHKHYGKYGEIQ